MDKAVAPVVQPEKQWVVGDPINVGMEARLRHVLMKVVAERNQYEATATELDLLVTTYKQAYEQASAEIARLKERLAVYEVPEKKPVALEPLRPLRKARIPQPDGFGN